MDDYQFVVPVETAAGVKLTFTSKGIERLKELGAQNVSPQVIAQELGANPLTVCRKLNEMGFSRARNSDVWSPERVERLKTLWAQGYSAGFIANDLGLVTRSAVLGKIHRLGLSGRVTATRIVDRRRAEARAKERQRQRMPKVEPKRNPQAMRWGKTPSLVALEPAPLPPEPQKPDKLVSFEGLKEGMCRFIFGDPRTKDHGYCGCQTAAGSSYCPGHNHMCFQAPQPRRRAERAVRHRVDHRLKEFAV